MMYILLFFSVFSTSMFSMEKPVASVYVAGSTTNGKLVQLKTFNDMLPGYDGTLLHYCVANGIIDKIKHYIMLGASVNSINSRGYTPLTFAVINNNPECAKELFECCADASIVDELGYRACDYLIGHDNPKMIELFKLYDAEYPNAELGDITKHILLKWQRITSLPKEKQDHFLSIFYAFQQNKKDIDRFCDFRKYAVVYGLLDLPLTKDPLNRFKNLQLKQVFIPFNSKKYNALTTSEMHEYNSTVINYLNDWEKTENLENLVKMCKKFKFI